jgi:hypothetical protein
MEYKEATEFVCDNEQQIVFHHIPTGLRFLQSPGISNQSYYLADMNDYQSASLSPQHNYSLANFLVGETTTATTVANSSLASSQMTGMQVNYPSPPLDRSSSLSNFRLANTKGDLPSTPLKSPKQRHPITAATIRHIIIIRTSSPKSGPRNLKSRRNRRKEKNQKNEV